MINLMLNSLNLEVQVFHPERDIADGMRPNCASGDYGRFPASNLNLSGFRLPIQ